MVDLGRLWRKIFKQKVSLREKEFNPAQKKLLNTK